MPSGSNTLFITCMTPLVRGISGKTIGMPFAKVRPERKLIKLKIHFIIIATCRKHKIC